MKFALIGLLIFGFLVAIFDDKTAKKNKDNTN